VKYTFDCTGTMAEEGEGWGVMTPVVVCAPNLTIVVVVMGVWIKEGVAILALHLPIPFPYEPTRAKEARVVYVGNPNEGQILNTTTTIPSHPTRNPPSEQQAQVDRQVVGEAAASTHNAAKKSLQSCWFDDDEPDLMTATPAASAADATEESDMDLDLLGPLSPPAFSKKKKGVAGSRLTPSKRSAENINLFDPFFSFSRRCVTAPTRSIGPLDNWLSDTLNNHN
jgi:hypothetical protein